MGFEWQFGTQSLHCREFLNNIAFSLSNGLYPNLSQCAELPAQTLQSLPNAVLSSQQLRCEPERNHPTRKPLSEYQ